MWSASMLVNLKFLATDRLHLPACAVYTLSFMPSLKARRLRCLLVARQHIRVNAGFLFDFIIQYQLPNFNF